MSMPRMRKFEASSGVGAMTVATILPKSEHSSASHGKQEEHALDGIGIQARRCEARIESAEPAEYLHNTREGRQPKEGPLPERDGLAAMDDYVALSV